MAQRQEVRHAVARSGGTLTRRTTAGVVVAVVALLVVQALVDAAGVDVGAEGPMSPFGVGPLVGTTVVAGVGAALVYAALVRFTDDPVANFVALAAVVFVLSLGPILLATPSMGVTPTGQGLLVVYHALVAVPLVVSLTGGVERRRVSSPPNDR